MCLRAFPRVLSMWLETVQFIVTKTKCAGLAQEIGFFIPDSCRLRWLVKRATQLCTSKKECNKLDLTAAQCFWFVQWFATSSPRVYVSFSFIGGVAKKQKVKLGYLILLSSVTYLALLEMLSFRYFLLRPFFPRWDMWSSGPLDGSIFVLEMGLPTADFGFWASTWAKVSPKGVLGK